MGVTSSSSIGLSKDTLNKGICNGDSGPKESGLNVGSVLQDDGRNDPGDSGSWNESEDSIGSVGKEECTAGIFLIDLFIGKSCGSWAGEGIEVCLFSSTSVHKAGVEIGEVSIRAG